MSTKKIDTVRDIGLLSRKWIPLKTGASEGVAVNVNPIMIISHVVKGKLAEIFAVEDIDVIRKIGSGIKAAVGKGIVVPGGDHEFAAGVGGKFTHDQGNGLFCCVVAIKNIARHKHYVDIVGLCPEHH